MAEADTDEGGGADAYIAGPGKPPRDVLQSRLQDGVITPAQAEEAEALLHLGRSDAPESLDAALNDIYTRRSSGDISEERFWRTRDAIGR